MRIKLIRCGICDSWLGTWRDHCHICGATRAVKIGTRFYYFDAARNFIPLARGFWSIRIWK